MWHLLSNMVTKRFFWVKKIISFKKGFALSLRDANLWFWVVRAPKFLFNWVYSRNLLDHYYKADYSNPKKLFQVSEINDMEMSLKVEELRKTTETSLQAYKYYNSKEKVTKTLNFKEQIPIKRALIICPNGWLDTKSEQWKTQGGNIRFLSKGLKDNGILCDVIEIHDQYIENKIANLDIDLIFIYSLSQCKPSITFVNQLKLRKDKADSRYNFLIGVNSSSPGDQNLNKSLEWLGIIDMMIYFEQESDFVSKLREIFKVVHLPFIQDDEVESEHSSQRGYDISFSSLIKYNRAAWVIGLRALCNSLNFSCSVRIISGILSKYFPIVLGYLSPEEISKIRLRSKSGLVLSHRESGKDAHLLGTFWDFYRYGCIPIVQSEVVGCEFASYLKKNLDYFEIESLEDLASVLIFIKTCPEIITQLQERIIFRMRHDFSPEVLVRGFLSQQVTK